MLSNYGYGLTDNSPNTPWNEPVVPEREFELLCSQTLSRSYTVNTNRYQPEFDDETGHIYTNTDDTSWSEVFDENGYHTPLQLIAILKEFLEKELKVWEDKPRDEEHPYKKSMEMTKLKSLIDECNDWQEDEIQFVEE